MKLKLLALALALLCSQPAEAGILRGIYRVATAPYRAGRAVVNYHVNCLKLGAYCMRYYWM